MNTNWNFQWEPAPGQSAPEVSICPFLYGKKWAYTVEIDDGPDFVLKFASDLFAQVEFTDAPPGIKGGKAFPVVGSVAVYPAIAGLSGYLGFEEMRQLNARGWKMANHSYAHRGRLFGDWPEILTPEQVRDQIYWCQAVLAQELGATETPAHFVYPNGYPGYQDYLTEFGIRSGSRSKGEGGRNLLASSLGILDMPRNYLDEKIWSDAGANDPMYRFAEDPVAGDLVIDFTHGIDGDPESPNHRRWRTRLKTIAERYGHLGADVFWSAPTEIVANYKFARDGACVEVCAEGLNLRLNEKSPGSRLTLRLDGVLPSTRINAPAGGVVYRHDKTVWLTTPELAGVPPPTFAKRTHLGIAPSITLERPVQLAGVLLRQKAKVEGKVECGVEVTLDNGSKVQLKPVELAVRQDRYTHLFPIVPNRDPLLAVAIDATPHSALGELEIWALG